MTKSQRKAHLKQAKYMYEERKRLGGRLRSVNGYLIGGTTGIGAA